MPDDPINAPGQLGYIYGTRAVRVVFRAKGWVINRRDNIESTVQPETRVRIIYQNTDTAGHLFPSPKAISEKGVAAERLIDLAEPFLFPDMEEERKAKIAEAKTRENETVWFLCVASDENGIWAEISRPRYIKNNQFGEFIERQNLTLRMSQRRLTRLSNGFSKKYENHCAAIALYVMHYNFCRVHEALRITPSMQLGITDHVWSVSELVAAALDGEIQTKVQTVLGQFRVINGGKA